MSSSVGLDTIVSSLVKSSPPGELDGISQDLSAILSSKSNFSTVNTAIEKYINENSGVFSSTYIASKINKHESSTKYIDFISKKLFNIDLHKQTAIDLEDYEPEVKYPAYFDELVKKLTEYGEDHYPSKYAFTIVPDGSDLQIIIIGQKLNYENFYTGLWKSHYRIKSGSIEGEAKLDIHYYEDGNVRLNFDELTSGTLSSSNASEIVNFINNAENEMTLKIVEDFNELNQKYFKNLRRLLPVTRSKINWGQAIGNYRLGSDVVHNK